MVSVSVVSDNSLQVSWTEPSSLTHLPTDTYTVTLTPDCRDGETGPDSPTPQTVAYNASPVTVNGLGMYAHNFTLVKIALFCLSIIIYP